MSSVLPRAPLLSLSAVEKPQPGKWQFRRKPGGAKQLPPLQRRPQAFSPGDRVVSKVQVKGHISKGEVCTVARVQAEKIWVDVDNGSKVWLEPSELEIQADPETGRQDLEGRESPTRTIERASIVYGVRPPSPTGNRRGLTRHRPPMVWNSSTIVQPGSENGASQTRELNALQLVKGASSPAEAEEDGDWDDVRSVQALQSAGSATRAGEDIDEFPEMAAAEIAVDMLDTIFGARMLEMGGPPDEDEALPPVMEESLRKGPHSPPPMGQFSLRRQMLPAQRTQPRSPSPVQRGQRGMPLLPVVPMPSLDDLLCSPRMKAPTFLSGRRAHRLDAPVPIRMPFTAR